jgi:hypothetical protein
MSMVIAGVDTIIIDTGMGTEGIGTIIGGIIMIGMGRISICGSTEGGRDEAIDLHVGRGGSAGAGRLRE